MTTVSGNFCFELMTGCTSLVIWSHNGAGYKVYRTTERDLAGIVRSRCTVLQLKYVLGPLSYHLYTPPLR